jgi:glycosyltransferase involved in cell wall biosynthesis
MKILIINSNDIIGGAARAAYRIHKGLQALGLDSSMLVQTKASDDPTVVGPVGKEAKILNILRPRLDSLPLRLYRDRLKTPWSVGWLPKKITNQIKHINPDIINLQWICGGFLPSTVLAQLNKPLVWTLQDCWAFTGGCHYPFGCTKYQKKCGSCPQLGSQNESDLSRWIWHKKYKYWQNLNIRVVAISQWVAECAQSSSLFRDSRIEVIPNGLDAQRFKPIEKREAREILNLPLDKNLVLFGAMNAFNPIKGFELLCSGLQKLNSAGYGGDMELVVFGASRSDEESDLPFPAHYLGYLHDHYSLALLYSACDLMVVPSKQEAFGQTATEAMACGTPVVAFNACGLKDIVDHQQNGYLAEPFETSDLAQGIAWVLSDHERQKSLQKAARAKVEQEFDMHIVAKKYLALFQELAKS